MRIIITGGSGFVGMNLIPYLEKGNVVTKVSMRLPSWSEDIDKDGDVFIHLAGKAHDTSNVSDDSEYFRVNCDLTKELFDLFLESKAKDFFYFSSVKAVADSVVDILEEDCSAKPLTPYGLSKFQAENYILDQKLPIGKRVFIIRPCMIHGPGNKGNLNLLYKIIDNGIPWPLASFNNRRSFLSIDNLCFLVQRMIYNTHIPSGVYNFADDEAISTNELIELIALSLNKKPRMWSVNKVFMQKVASVGDLWCLPLNSERLKKLTENYVVSNRKIKKALFLEKMPITAQEGLLKTLDSFQM